MSQLLRVHPLEAGARVKAAAELGPRRSLIGEVLMLLGSDKLPECGGVSATILLLMTEEQFHTRHGLVQTGRAAHISVDEALSLFGDSRVMPVVLGKTRQIIAYGDTHRIFTENQRLAMTLRDKGCSFPGCTDPPSRCQAHHITDYSITRKTSVADGTLLCGLHHREYPKRGWTCQMINGIPHGTAPPWIDPTQTPRPNRAHHLHELAAQLATAIAGGHGDG